MDHSQSDCFVCIILSHGDEGGLVYGVDCKTVHMDDLRSYFKGDKCPSLVGKPKIFFIQACSGLKEDRGVTASDSQVSKVDEKAEYRIPLEADFLLAYAVVPGFLSWRDPRKGSWFIQAVVDVFTEHWTHMDLESMLIDVKGRVAKDFEGQSEDGIVKQMPSITSMLRKRVFFAIKQK